MASEGFRRRVMGGYDPAQVDRALAERDERLDQLEREAQQLAGRVIDAERRLRAQVSGIAEAAGAIGVSAGAWTSSAARRGAAP